MYKQKNKTVHCAIYNKWLVQSSFSISIIEFWFSSSIWFSEKVDNDDDVEKSNGNSLWCVRICDRRLQDNENFFKQYWHWNGFWPVCIRIWFLRLVCFENPLVQIGHRNGHVPLWTCKWQRRSPGVAKLFEHCEHLCGLSYLKINKFYKN